MIARNWIAFMPASVVSTAPDPSKLNETTPRGKIIRHLNEPIEKRQESISMMSSADSTESRRRSLILEFPDPPPARKVTDE